MGSRAGWGSLSVSLFSSTIGAWVLFAIPSVTGNGGVVAAAGYTLGACAPLALLALLGPTVRRARPAACNLSDFVRAECGALGGYVVEAASQVFQFAFLAVEYNAIFQVANFMCGNRLSGPWQVTVGVGLVTAAYSALGGLPVSIATDRVQGVAALGLAVAISAATLARAGGEATSSGWDSALAVTGESWASFGAVLVVLTVMPVFHQGLWQRVYAARSDRDLRLGCAGAGALSVVCVASLGAAGVAAEAARASDAAASFFQVKEVAFQTMVLDLGRGWMLSSLVLAVALVVSSVDTLQSAFVALLDSELSRSRGISPPAAFALSVAASSLINAPAIVFVELTVEPVSQDAVLDLLFVSACLCASLFGPLVLAVAARPSRSTAALAGGLACGLAGLFAYGALDGKGGTGFVGGLEQLRLNGDAYSAETATALGIAVGASTAASLAVAAASCVAPRRRGLDCGGGAPQAGAGRGGADGGGPGGRRVPFNTRGPRGPSPPPPQM